MFHVKQFSAIHARNRRRVSENSGPNRPENNPENRTCKSAKVQTKAGNRAISRKNRHPHSAEAPIPLQDRTTGRNASLPQAHGIAGCLGSRLNDGADFPKDDARPMNFPASTHRDSPVRAGKGSRHRACDAGDAMVHAAATTVLLLSLPPSSHGPLA